MPFYFLAIVSSIPIDGDEKKSLSVNDFFKEINENLKRDIEKALKNDTDIEVGDKFENKGNNSDTKVSIQSFSIGVDNFPVIFKPKNDSLADDKEITPIKGDFDESVAVYKIENEDSSESSEDLSTKAPEKALNKSSTKKTSESSWKLKNNSSFEEASNVPILTTV